MKLEIDSTSKSDAQAILSISRKILMSYAEQIHLLNFNKHLLAFNASNKFGAVQWVADLFFSLSWTAWFKQIENMIPIKYDMKIWYP